MPLPAHRPGFQHKHLHSFARGPSLALEPALWPNSRPEVPWNLHPWEQLSTDYKHPAFWACGISPLFSASVANRGDLLEKNTIYWLPSLPCLPFPLLCLYFVQQLSICFKGTQMKSQPMGLNETAKKSSKQQMPLPGSTCCPFRPTGADTDQLIPLSPELSTVSHQPGKAESGIRVQLTSSPDSVYSGSSPAYLSARLTVQAAWDEGKTPDLPPSNLTLGLSSTFLK